MLLSTVLTIMVTYVVKYSVKQGEALLLVCNNTHNQQLAQQPQLYSTPRNLGINIR